MWVVLGEYSAGKTIEDPRFKLSEGKKYFEVFLKKRLRKIDFETSEVHISVIFLSIMSIPVLSDMSVA